jgi:hypothetical protein
MCNLGRGVLTTHHTRAHTYTTFHVQYSHENQSKRKTRRLYNLLNNI